MLSPFKADNTIKKWGCKWGTIHSNRMRNFEIIFTLLIKMIVIYMKFPWIGFWRSNLKWLFSRLYLLLVLSLDWFYKCFYEFCEEVLDERNKRWNRSLRKGKSFRKDKSLDAAGIWFSYLALEANKLILFSSGIGRKIIARALSSMKFWSYCNKDLIMIFLNEPADLLGMELLEL